MMILLGMWLLTASASYAQVGEPIVGDSMQSLVGLKLDSWQEQVRLPLKLLKLSNGKGVYTAPSGNWDGVSVSKIQVTFFNRKLMSITVVTEDKGSSEKLLTMLQQRWGSGEQYGYAPRYTWSSKYTTAEYDENLISHKATLELVSLTQLRAWERQFAGQLED